MTQQNSPNGGDAARASQATIAPGRSVFSTPLQSSTTAPSPFASQQSVFAQPATQQQQQQQSVFGGSVFGSSFAFSSSSQQQQPTTTPATTTSTNAVNSTNSDRIIAADEPEISKEDRQKRFTSNTPASTIRTRLKQQRDARESAFFASYKPKKLSEATNITGTCLEMCPEFERYDREVTGELAVFEIRKGTMDEVDHERAVKKYRRSAAGQDPEIFPEDIRPPQVLKRTMDYLVGEILPRTDVPFEEVYNFIRDRGRALRKDFKIQNHLRGTECVNVLERMARFLIHCDFELCHLPESKFSPKQNRHQLVDTLTTLMEVYDDESRRQRIQYPNEPEFRAYFILLMLDDSVPIDCLQDWHPSVLQDLRVRNALLFHQYFQNHLASPFMHLLANATTTYLMGCVLAISVPQLRQDMIRMLHSSQLARDARPLDLRVLMQMLGLGSTEEAQKFARHFDLDVVSGEGVRVGRRDLKTSYVEPVAGFEVSKMKVVEEKRNGATHLQIVNGELSSIPGTSGSTTLNQIQIGAKSIFGSGTASAAGVSGSSVFGGLSSSQEPMQSKFAIKFGGSTFASGTASDGTDIPSKSVFGASLGSGAGSVFGSAPFASGSTASDKLAFSFGSGSGMDAKASLGPAAIKSGFTFGSAKQDQQQPTSMIFGGKTEPITQVKPPVEERKETPEQPGIKLDRNKESDRVFKEIWEETSAQLATSIAQEVFQEYRARQNVTSTILDLLMSEVVREIVSDAKNTLLHQQRIAQAVSKQASTHLTDETLQEVLRELVAECVAEDHRRQRLVRQCSTQWLKRARAQIHARKVREERRKQLVETVKSIPVLIPTSPRKPRVGAVTSATPQVPSGAVGLAQLLSGSEKQQPQRKVWTEPRMKLPLAAASNSLALLIDSLAQKASRTLDLPSACHVLLTKNGGYIKLIVSGCGTKIAALHSWLIQRMRMGAVPAELKNQHRKGVLLTAANRASPGNIKTEQQVLREYKMDASGWTPKNVAVSVETLSYFEMNDTEVPTPRSSAMGSRSSSVVPSVNSSAVVLVQNVDVVPCEGVELNTVRSENYACPLSGGNAVLFHAVFTEENGNMVVERSRLKQLLSLLPRATRVPLVIAYWSQVEQHSAVIVERQLEVQALVKTGWISEFSIVFLGYLDGRLGVSAAISELEKGVKWLSFHAPMRPNLKSNPFVPLVDRGAPLLAGIGKRLNVRYEAFYAQVPLVKVKVLDTLTKLLNMLVESCYEVLTTQSLQSLNWPPLEMVAYPPKSIQPIVPLDWNSKKTLAGQARCVLTFKCPQVDLEHAKEAYAVDREIGRCTRTLLNKYFEQTFTLLTRGRITAQDRADFHRLLNSPVDEIFDFLVDRSLNMLERSGPPMSFYLPGDLEALIKKLEMDVWTTIEQDSQAIDLIVRQHAITKNARRRQSSWGLADTAKRHRSTADDESEVICKLRRELEDTRRLETLLQSALQQHLE